MDRERRAEARREDWDPLRLEARRQRLDRGARYGESTRIAVLSGIHGNLEALTAVAEDIAHQNCQLIVCLGDTLGCGANPVECLDWVIANAHVSVLGSAEAIVIDRSNPKFYGHYTIQALKWHRLLLGETHEEYLLSLSYLACFEDATFAHGALYAPELFDYIQTTYEAYLSLQLCETPLYFHGQSHSPLTFFYGEEISYSHSNFIAVEAGNKLIVCVGSVGQPQDGNPKASYVIYDRKERTVEIRRVEYDVELARDKIYEAPVEDLFGDRLLRGL